MRRSRYDEGSGADRWRWEREVLRPDWGRPHPDDPNWRDGQYHGLRSGGGPWQGAYGRQREASREDLGGWGGVQGRYRRPMGGFGRDGLLGYEERRRALRDPVSPAETHPYMEEDSWQGGGVRGGVGYLRQYNARSPALRYGREFDRGYGWVEREHHGNLYPDPGPTREREYGGYNRAGWAPGTWVGPGSRVGRR